MGGRFILWDVERREDGTVVAIHPYGRWLTPDEYRSLGEMELPALTQAVTDGPPGAYCRKRAGRIGEDEQPAHVGHRREPAPPVLF